MVARASRVLLLILLVLVGAPARAAGHARVQELQQDEPTPRQAPKVRAIFVEGARSYSQSQIAAALGQRVGEPWDPIEARRGEDALWRAFHVRIDDLDLRGFDADGKLVESPANWVEVEILLRITEMPVDLEPRFIGHEKIKEKRLREWANLEERAELFLHQAPRVARRIEDGYRNEGFRFAEVREVVRGSGEADDAVPDVIFEIKEGPKVRVRNLVIVGNESLPDRGALFWKSGLVNQSRVEQKSSPRRKIRWYNPLSWLNPFNWRRGKPFVEEKLEADLIAMRNTYRQRGWLDAVVELDRLEFSDDRSKVDIYVRIDEGVRYTVASLDIEAVEVVKDADEAGATEERPAEFVVDKEELLALCQLKPGSFYEQLTLSTDTLRLREHYGTRGYLSHRSLEVTARWQFLDPKVQWDSERKEVHVTYRIMQGRKRFLREILFSGVKTTRDRVMRREVTAEPGKLADQKEIEASMRQLEGTGYFSNPNDPAHPPPDYVFRTTDDPDTVDLEFQLEEGRAADFNFGGSLSTDFGVSAFVSFAVPNFDLFNPPSSLGSAFSEMYRGEAFRGAGQFLKLTLSPGSEINYWEIRFIEPDILRKHYDPWGFDLLLQRRERFFEEYDEDRSQLTPRMIKRIGNDITVSTGITLQEIDVSDPVENPPDTLAQSVGDHDLNGILFEIDYRDLEGTFGNRKGYRVFWDNGVYVPWLSGSEEFVKSDVGFRGWLPTGDPLEDVRPYFSLETDLGVAPPYGDTDFVIYPERFFLGGSANLRGFDYRGVGPNQNGQPIGGETRLRASLEFRLPLSTTTRPGTYREQEVFHMALFTDWGVYDPDPWQLDVDEFRGSVGFGFGINIPFGPGLPLRIDYAFPVVEGEGDDIRNISLNFAGNRR